MRAQQGIETAGSIRFPRPGRLLAAIAAVLALVVAACGGGGGSAGTGAPAGEPVRGGSLTYLTLFNLFRGMDPAKTDWLEGYAYLPLVYDKLMHAGPDGPTPGIAQSAEPSDDQSTWTISLRPGVTFQDGTPFDSAAVKAHWERMKDPATVSPERSDLNDVATIETPDPQTLVITLTRPDATFGQVLTTNAGMVPSPTAVERFGATYGTSAEKIVGAGPFRPAEYVPGDRFRFVRYDGYWEAPKPYLDEVLVRPVIDGNTRFLLFSTGDGDIFESGSADDQVVQLEEGDYQGGIVQSANSSFGGLAIRTDVAPTDDVRVREALQRGVDWESVLARTAPATEPYGELYSGVAYPQTDPARAQQLIDEYRAETGVASVDVNLYVSTSRTALWEALLQDWNAIEGLNVTLQLAENAATSAAIASRDYRHLLAWGMPFESRTISRDLRSNSSTNVPYLSDPQLDQWAEQMMQTPEGPERDALLQQYARRVAELVPFIGLSGPTWSIFWQNNVHGVEPNVHSRLGSFRWQDVWKEQ